MMNRRRSGLEVFIVLAEGREMVLKPVMEGCNACMERFSMESYTNKFKVFLDETHDSSFFVQLRLKL